jgi:quercetin dioxygenase-like cupin family protein
MNSHSPRLTFALVVAAVILAVAAREGLACGSMGGRIPDATPAASPITISMLGKGMPANAPGNYLELDRVTLAPGAEIPTHVHPGAYVITVESGDFGFTVIKGEAQITRAGATESEPIAAGPEVVGHAGDAFFENGGVVHSARNLGATPVVLLTAGLLANDQPSIQMTNDEGTPMP